MGQTKQAVNKIRKHPKMDKYLVSTQKHELLYVRTIFFKYVREVEIVHPPSGTIKNLIKKCNNSRRKIYLELENLDYINIKKKKSIFDFS